MEELNRTTENPFVTLLGAQYEILQEIAAEAVNVLGAEQAGFFTYLFNDWMDVWGAISTAYPEEELAQSLVYFYLVGLSKEVRWLQLHFLSGNYSLLHRDLRHIWEMVFRGYYVDTHAKKEETDPEPPGPTLDEKIAWMAEHERDLFTWGEFMRLTLRRLVPKVKGTDVERYYKLLWDNLNEHVHPSAALLDRMATWSPESWVKDAFSEEWALEAINSATMVFDLVWVAVLSRFPCCVDMLEERGFHLEYPLISNALETAC